MIEITTTASGLQYFDFKLGLGKAATVGSLVKINYMAARNLDEISIGPWIENSYKRSPVVVRLGNEEVIKGLDEGIIGMRVSSHRRFIIPPELAFGERGIPGLIEPNATIFIEIYLIDILN